MEFCDPNLSVLLNRLEIDCVTGNFQDRELKIDLELCRRTMDNYEYIKDLEILKEYIRNHEYDTILKTEFFCLKSLKERSKDFTFVFYEKYGVVKSNYQHLFHPPGEDCPYVKQLILLFIAVSALQEFVKANVCGPTMHEEAEYTICDNLLPNSRYSDECILDALGQDGEVVLSKIVHPKLLFLSLILLFGNSFDKCLTHRWWLFRCIMIHQRILPDPMSDLHNLFTSLVSKQLEAKFLKKKEEPLAEMMFYIECAYAHLYYKELNVAEKYIISAQNVLGLGINFKRAPITQLKFNNRPCAKVVIEVKRNDLRYQSKLSCNQCTFPCYVYRNDVEFLDSIYMKDSNGKRIKELLPEEQIILLAYCDLIRERSGKSFKEEILTIASILLSCPKIWAIHFKALIHRTQTIITVPEYRDQLKELLICIKECTPPFSIRQTMLYCVSLPMKYDVKKIFADKLLVIGDPKNALPLYIKLNLWDGAVDCYKSINAISKGVRALNAQIASRPSSILWCYLGDLTGNPDVYKVAWKLSRYTNARSQRCLGYYYYKKKLYKESIYHFKKSLIANYLQPEVLYAMGLAAKSCNDNDVAIDAFTTVVKIDETNFQAWNYLARAYIRRNEKIRACECLLECMRHSDENEYWKSYLLVSAHIHSFQDVINGYHKFLDNGKRLGVHELHPIHLDILNVLVDAVCKDVNDINNIPSSYLKTVSLLLFERITKISHVASASAQVWELYAQLHCAGNDERVEAEALLYQRKALHLYIYAAATEKSEEVLTMLLKVALKCIHMSLTHVQGVHSIAKKRQELASTSNLVHEVLVKTSKFKASGFLSAEFNELLSSLKRSFETIRRV